MLAALSELALTSPTILTNARVLPEKVVASSLRSMSP